MRVVLREWNPVLPPPMAAAPNPARRLVLAFGAPQKLEASWPALQEQVQEATLLGCSTAGEILGATVSDRSIAVATVDFERTDLRAAMSDLESGSRAAGERIAAQLLAPELRHVLVFSDGLEVNGTDLVAGFEAVLPSNVVVTGGLAGDGADFRRTLVGLKGTLQSGVVAAVGLYGSAIRTRSASLGGWDPFGVERIVTRSIANVVYELDGQPALDLYKRFLGAHSAGLPGSALLFPLSVRMSDGDTPVVRTVLAVDPADNSMTFAGDVPQGARARLMKANFDRLIDGAAGAAERVHLGDDVCELAILISCVGRKLVLQQRIEEEVEAVQGVLGTQTPLVGFYSYGEISPFTPKARCELHNQTMTITALSEAA